MAATRSFQPIRWVLLALLLAVVAAVAADLRSFAAAADGAPITALRTKPVGAVEAGGGEGSVDAFCGFAPCGMPLECN